MLPSLAPRVTASMASACFSLRFEHRGLTAQLMPQHTTRSAHRALPDRLRHMSQHILRSAHCALPDRAAMERSLTIIFSPSSSPTLRPTPPQYEAYEPMARTELLAICRQMRERWPLRHIAIAHRTGVVPLAEASVEIAVSAFRPA